LLLFSLDYCQGSYTLPLHQIERKLLVTEHQDPSAKSHNDRPYTFPISSDWHALRGPQYPDSRETRGPIHTFDQGRIMLTRLALDRGYTLLSDARVAELGDMFKTIIARAFLEAEDTNPDIEAHCIGGVVDSNGTSQLLIVFVSDNTAAHFLPSLTIDAEGQQQFALCSPSMNFQGILCPIDFKIHKENKEQISFIFGKMVYLLTPENLHNELSLIAHFDLRGALSGELERLMLLIGKSTDNIEHITVARDKLVSASTYRFLLHLDDDSLVAVSLGAKGAVPLIECDYAIRFVPNQPPRQNHEKNALLSHLTAFRELTGAIAIESPAARQEYEVEKLEEHCTHQLQTLFGNAWTAEMKLDFRNAQLFPNGQIRIVAAVLDADLNYLFAWPDNTNSARSVLSSSTFMGYLFEFLPLEIGDDSLLFQGFEHGTIEGLFLPAEVMEEHINLLHSDPGKSIFCNQILRTITEQLVSHDEITDLQASALSIRKCYTVKTADVVLTDCVSGDIYWILVEHSLGTHLLRIHRASGLGLLPIGEHQIVPFAYFPLETAYGEQPKRHHNDEIF
jgi:hypothetical protein